MTVWHNYMLVYACLRPYIASHEKRCVLRLRKSRHNWKRKGNRVGGDFGRNFYLKKKKLQAAPLACLQFMQFGVFFYCQWPCGVLAGELERKKLTFFCKDCGGGTCLLRGGFFNFIFIFLTHVLCSIYLEHISWKINCFWKPCGQRTIPLGGTLK